jgi:hypothetical protein
MAKEHGDTVAIMAAIIYAARANQKDFAPKQATFEAAAQEAGLLYMTVNPPSSVSMTADWT